MSSAPAADKGRRAVKLSEGQAEALSSFVQQAREAEAALRTALSLVGMEKDETLDGCDLTKGDESFVRFRSTKAAGAEE